MTCSGERAQALPSRRLRISGSSMSDGVSAGGAGNSVPRDRQVAWQRRAVAVLGELLQRAESEAVPVVEWEVGDVGPALLGRCAGPSVPAQVEAFDAWHALLGPADRVTENRIGALTRKIASWERYQGVHVVLAADLLDDDYWEREVDEAFAAAESPGEG
jgi:hypothetical protein